MPLGQGVLWLATLAAAFGSSAAASAQAVSNPAPVTFSPQTVGVAQAQVAIPFTVTAATFFNSSPTIGNEGSTASDFSLGTGSTCTGNVMPGTCKVYVIFKPRTPGIRLGAVSLFSGGATPAATALISGVGEGPAISYPGSTTPTVINSTVSAHGMIFDTYGNLYYPDPGSSSIRELLANANGIYSASNVRTVFSGISAYDVAVDGVGNLYVSDTGNNQIKELVAVNGVVTTSSTVRILGSGFSHPQGIAVDAQGNVYVCDNFNNVIKKIVAVNGVIPATNPTILTIATGTSRADGIRLDASGNVFFADSTNYQVKEILASTGQVVVLAQFSDYIYCVALDPAGDLFVSAIDNLYEFFAVNGSIPPGTAATINYGVGSEALAIDQNGNLFYDTMPGLKEINLTYAPIAFPSTAVGTTASSTLAIANSGNQPLTFTVPASGSNPGLSGVFSPGSSSTCPLLTANSYDASTLAPGASCTQVVNFTPGSYGTYAGNLVLNYLNATKASTTLNVPLSGVGTAATGTSPQTITFNPPATILAGSNLTLSATASSGLPVTFGVANGSGTIVGSTLIMPSSGTGTVLVRALQSGNGNYAAAPQITKSITILPDTAVGSTASSTISATVTITTAGMLGKINVLTLGQSNQDFTLSSAGSCYVGSNYQLNYTCTAYVTFKPTTPGLRRGAVQLTDSTGTKILGTALLTATGNGPMAVYPVRAQAQTVGSGWDVPTTPLFDSAGDLYVASRAGIIEIPAVGGVLPANPSPITLPSNGATEGVALDGAGNLFYDDDYSRHVTEVVAVGGKIPANPTVRTFAVGQIGLNPGGVAVDRFNNLYVADASNHQILEILAVNGVIPDNPTIITLCSNVSSPSALAIDSAGDLFFSDGGNLLIIELVAVGGTMPANPAEISTGLNISYSGGGLVFDAAGDLFYTDAQNEAVYEVPAINGSLPANPSVMPIYQFTAPYLLPPGITVDNRGNLYVTDGEYGVYEIPLATPAGINFANADAGSTSTDSPTGITLQNIGNAPLTLSALAATANFPVDAPTTTCAASSTVSPSESCTVGLDFSPTSVGAISGTFTFTDNNLAVAGSNQVAQLNGTGLGLAVTGVSPAGGPPTGGNTVTIFGTALSGARSVTFGGTAASGLTVINDTTVTAVAPPGIAGTVVDITIATANSVSTANGADQYIYQLPATLAFSIPDAHTGDPDFQLAATSNSPGNITYTVVSGPASIYNGNTVSLNPGAAGRVVIEADQSAGGLYAAASIQTAFTVEQGTGSVWIVNGDGTVSEYDLNGNLLSPPAGSTGAAVGTVPSPQGAAFDSLGDLWIVGVNGVNYYTPNGTPGSTTPLTAGGISNPKSVIVDGTGHVWILNGNGSVSLLTGTGSPISPATGYTGGGITSPSALTIDTGGNLWITNGDNSMTEILGGAGPIAPLAIGVQNGTTGARP